MNIIQNDSLRWLLKQGPNFREQKSKSNFNRIWNNIKSGINECIEKWAKLENKPIEILTEWKIKLLKKLKINFNRIRANPRKNNFEILKDEKCLKDLEEIHSKYIVVPIDKASSNIALVCKPFYFRTLLDEIGIIQNGNDTYKILDQTENVIVNMQKRFIHATASGLPILSNKLPFIYAIPKMHKKPVKFRFLVSQKYCPLKSLNQSISKILKLVLKIHKNWCNSLHKYTGIKHMWIAENYNDVISKISKINSRTKAISTKQFDFTSLYTSLPKQFLIQNLNWCLEKAFIGGKKKYISVYSQDARFVNHPSEKTIHFSLESLKNVLAFVIDHSYFTLGDIRVKQIKGIGMGWDPAPFVANLSLYACEHKYQSKTLKSNYSIAKQNNNNSRYIDDINILNNRSFENELTRIYPSEIICNRENINENSGHFLELDITIENGKFKTKLFDKRREFDFEIVKYPDTRSNIPDRIVYSTYVSQLLRCMRVCCDFEDFQAESRVLISKFFDKGCKIDRLKSKTNSCINSHILDFSKFNMRVKNVLEILFPLM